MDNTVLIKNYDEPVYNKNEILRYLNVKETTPEIQSLISECIDELDGKLTYKVCWHISNVKCSSGVVDFGFARAKSSDLEKNLINCEKALIFGATVGLEIDRLINKYNYLSPTKALIFQSIGTERIESLCDKFCEDVKLNCFTKPRFSPGYGNLAIEFQKEIFRVLDLPRRIGLTLNESLIMTPSKSVTAIVGISDFACNEKTTGCLSCNNKECEFRRE